MSHSAILCARQIGDIGRLKMLYLLTVADSISTGPKAWNEWTATLLKDFFFKVLNILEKGELATHEAVKRVENKKERIMETVSKFQTRENLDALFLTFHEAHVYVDRIADLKIGN